MPRLVIWRILSGLLVCHAVCLHAATETQQYLVGVARKDITPDYPVRLNGFGFRRTESEGVTQPIWAKALAIATDPQKPLVLITLDSLGIRETMVDEVASRLRVQHGIERSQIVVTFSHSHTTPKVVGACDTIFSTPIPPEHQARIEKYTKELANAVEEVASDALRNLQPATLSWSIGSVGFAKNRRPQGGPVDHSLPVLFARSAADDSLLAIYSTYACHCVTLSNNKISGDWAGFAQKAIETRHPGVVALVSIGCGSDANPDSGVTGDNIAIASSQGDQIAEEVDRLLRTELHPVRGDIQYSLEHLPLPLNPPPGEKELQELAAKGGAAGYNAEFHLSKLHIGEQLLTSLAYPIHTLEFGDSLAMVFLGGEICCDYAVRIREKLDASRIWLHGYSNDFCAYIPSERLLKEGGYGGGAEVVYFALPSTLAPGLESRILNQVQKQVSEQFHTAGAKEEKKSPATLSIQESLDAIELRDGLTVELVAAEPLVADPVAIDFAADGKLWVAEMPDYSRFPDEQFEHHGKVRQLSDQNGDGIYDTPVVFIDGLRFPTDVKAWRDGVIVCDAPDVLFFRDSDGDGSADQRQVLLTGFATQNPQARVNSIRLGLDNWLYGACGLIGGEIQSQTGEKLILGKRDFRFRPDTGEIEPVTGRTQQGRARTDWGDWFGCENESLLDHYPFEDHYLARNPRLVPPPAERSSPLTKTIGLHPIGQPTLFALSGPPGRPTSVCGLDFYRDELLGKEFSNNAFVAEPVNQLVRRMILNPGGASFAANVASDEQDKEFLASTDPWFRPVQVRTGPDGCLYLVDMHRAVIEHQKFIPEEVLRELNLYAGNDQGRILRIRPEGRKPRPIVDYSNLGVEQIVRALDTPNGTTRDLLHELLVYRNDPEAIHLLRDLYYQSKRAATRLQTLCILDAIQGLDEEILITALDDRSSAIRRHAIRLGEPWIAKSTEVAESLLGRADDPDVKVRLQLACSLGEWQDPRATKTLARIALANPNAPYVLACVWSSVGSHNAAALLEELAQQQPMSDLPATVRNPAIKFVLELSKPEEYQQLAGLLFKLIDNRVYTWQLEAAEQFAKQLKRKPDSSQSFLDRIEPQIAAAREYLEYSENGESERIAAIRLLAAVSSSEELGQLLTTYMQPSSPPNLQRATVALTFTSLQPESAVDLVVENWTGLSAEARSLAFSTISSKQEHAQQFLQSISDGLIDPTMLDANQRERLLSHPDSGVRAQASNTFETVARVDRQALVEQYIAAFDDSGSAERGKEVFAKACSACHLLEGIGHQVGPDIAALSSRTPEILIESILNPNKTFDDRYRNYLVVTNDGFTYSGIISEETSNSITIVDQQAKPHTVLRTDIDMLSMTGVSLMPEGLEQDITPDTMGHLVAYLRSLQTSAKVQSNGTSLRSYPAMKDLISALDGLEVGRPSEYERIPRLWEIASAAGRRNVTQELIQFLSLALPRGQNASVADWQVVVLGGGIVKGISESGDWPQRRMDFLLREARYPMGHWQEVLRQALEKAENPAIPLGTRYDALRLLGASDWNHSGKYLVKFLREDYAPDLQIGAVEAIADLNAADADEVLVDAIARLESDARRGAVRGLLRTSKRANYLATSLAEGRLSREMLTTDEMHTLQGYFHPHKAEIP